MHEFDKSYLLRKKPKKSLCIKHYLLVWSLYPYINIITYLNQNKHLKLFIVLNIKIAIFINFYISNFKYILQEIT